MRDLTKGTYIRTREGSEYKIADGNITRRLIPCLKATHVITYFYNDDREEDISEDELKHDLFIPINEVTGIITIK